MRKNPRKSNLKKISLVFCVIVLIISSCKSVFKTSAYKAYVNSLESAGLSESKMGSTWIRIGELALSNPTQQVVTPFKERIYFQDNSPGALGYKINYKKGRKLKFKINTSAKETFGLFIDLYEAGEKLKNVISDKSRDTTFYYEDNDNKVLVMRLQPELLISGSVDIEIIEEAKLGFPVSGGSNKSIQSFWGVDREGGARKHEGIDIFARRGTPVLAVADGVISRVQETPIGGKVVWQRLGLFNQSIYYAHLDSQLVTSGQEVKKGEPVGRVGNTGNAKTTSPHLHFGIYTIGGAIDPLEYVVLGDTTPAPLKNEVRYLGQQVMVSKNRNLIIPAYVVAVSSDSITYRNQFDGIEKVKTLAVSSKKLTDRIKKDQQIYEMPGSAETIIGELKTNQEYEVWGLSKDSLYVHKGAVRGWVSRN